MELKEKLEAAVSNKEKKKKEYERACEEVRRIVLEYFSLKLGVSPGDEVYSLVEDNASGNGKRRKLKLVSFVLWTDNLDAQPDIMAETIFPYGNARARRVLGRNWSVDPPDDWGNEG